MRLIDADALKKQYYPFPCAIGVENVVTIRAINEAPTIDAVPVVRGEWVVTDAYPHRVYCSLGDKTNVPNEDWLYEKNDYPKYCMCCGAQMED